MKVIAMKRKLIILITFAVVILLSITIGISLAVPSPSGYVWTTDGNTAYNQGVAVTVEWATSGTTISSSNPLTIWLALDGTVAEISNEFTWVQTSSATTTLTFNTADLSVGQTYDILMSIQSKGSTVILNQNDYAYFTIMTSCQSSDFTTVVTTAPSQNVEVNQPNTGVQTTVYLNRNTVPAGTSVTISSAYYGSNAPSYLGTAGLLSVNGVYYDVQVISSQIDVGTPIQIQITNDIINANSQIQYWDTSLSTPAWVTLPGTFAAPHTLTVTLQYDQMGGTTFFVTPEYALGSLLAVGACVVGLVVYKAKHNLPHIRPAAIIKSLQE